MSGNATECAGACYGGASYRKRPHQKCYEKACVCVLRQTTDGKVHDRRLTREQVAMCARERPSC